MAYIYDLADTWNASGTTFTAIKMNVTDSASTSGSLLMDLQVGGVSRFSVDKAGAIFVPSTIGYANAGIRFSGIGPRIYASSNLFAIANGSYGMIGGDFGATQARINGGVAFGFSSGDISTSLDVILNRDAANTLAQRNSVNAQAFRLYNTFTDASNYERGYLISNSDGFTLGTEAAGTGVKRPVRIAGPSLAASEAVSLLDMIQTWNTTGTPTAIRANITDTASNAASLLMDLQVGGVSRFNINKAGAATTTWVNSNFIGSYTGSSPIYFGVNNASSTFAYAALGVTGSQPGFTVRGAIPIGWSSVSNSADNAPDLTLFRDAANTLAQRNGVNAQAFNIYNTYTDASNYERGFMRWVSNALQIGTERLGTGTARNLQFHTNGANRFEILSDGSVRSLGGFFYVLGSSVTGIWAQFGGANNYIGTESNHAFNIRTNNTEKIGIDTVGSVRISTALTVATLPATPLVGMMARVTNANAPTVGSTVVGGGSANAMCWYNGTNWTVIGV